MQENELNGFTKPLSRRIVDGYLSEFQPRTIIEEALTPEEIKLLLFDLEIDRAVLTSWHFKFYLKQAILRSMEKWKGIDRYEFLQELHTESEWRAGRGVQSLIASAQLYFCKDKLSLHELAQMFRGLFFDDWCAQIAFEEYERRRQEGSGGASQNP